MRTLSSSPNPRRNPSLVNRRRTLSRLRKQSPSKNRAVSRGCGPKSEVQTTRFGEFGGSKRPLEYSPELQGSAFKKDTSQQKSGAGNFRWRMADSRPASLRERNLTASTFHTSFDTLFGPVRFSRLVRLANASDLSARYFCIKERTDDGSSGFARLRLVVLVDKRSSLCLALTIVQAVLR